MTRAWLLVCASSGLIVSGCAGEEFASSGAAGSGNGGGASGAGGAVSGGGGGVSGSGAVAGGGSAGLSGSGGQGGSAGQGGSGGLAGSGASGGAGGAGGAGGSGGTGGVSYPSRVCNVLTNQGSSPSSPSCTTGAGCVEDFAGAFGMPGEADGTGASARFVGAYGLAANDTHLFVSTAHAIRRVNLTSGVVDTLAGTGQPGNADGKGTSASFNCPSGLALHSGILYVADTGNDRVREVALLDGNVTTHATVTKPVGAATNPNKLFVTSPSTNSVFSVSYTSGPPVPLTSASPASSEPMALAWTGSLFYLTDADREVVRKASESALSSFIGVGADGQSGYVDATQGNNARLKAPHGISVRQNPLTIFIADRENHAIRQAIPGSGYATTTIAGDGNSGHVVGVGTAAKLTEPTDIVFIDNTLYVAEGTVIRRIKL